MQLLILIFSTAIHIVLSNTALGPCDFKKYPSTGCRDQFGAECEAKSGQCLCKEGYWYVVYGAFCFPEECARGFYYDHNYKRCEPQRKPSESEENHCKYDFQCLGKNVRCQTGVGPNSWEKRCVCNKGFVYDLASGQCQKIKGFFGYCVTDNDCQRHEQQWFTCIDNTCQCAPGYTYNSVIDGCEDNEFIRQRDSQTRTLIYIFIFMGILFGAALSLKFGSSHSTSQFLLKRMVNSASAEPSAPPENMTNSLRLTSRETA